MLVLKRKTGQWVEITHSSGDVLRVRVTALRTDACDLVFDDPARDFDIQRPERKPWLGESGHAAPAPEGSDGPPAVPVPQSPLRDGLSCR